MHTYKGNLIHRLQIVRGHLNAIGRMIQRDEYCIHISQQIKAVRGALRRIDELILEYYLKNCCHNTKQLLDSKNNVAQILKVFNRWN